MRMYRSRHKFGCSELPKGVLDPVSWSSEEVEKLDAEMERVEKVVEALHESWKVRALSDGKRLDI